MKDYYDNGIYIRIFKPRVKVTIKLKIRPKWASKLKSTWSKICAVVASDGSFVTLTDLENNDEYKIHADSLSNTTQRLHREPLTPYFAT